MAEIDVEVNVLSNDGGALAASLMAASFAIISANIECFDIILATHFIFFDNGHVIIDPNIDQIDESFNLNKQLNNNEMEVDEAKIVQTNCVELTIAIAPSLGQVLVKIFLFFKQQNLINIYKFLCFIFLGYIF